MVTEQYVSFETAKLLKDKGFDKKCVYRYIGEPDYGSKPPFVHFPKGNGSQYIYPAPTQALAMRWLREVHNLHIDIDVSEGDWNPCVIELENWSVVSEYDTENTQDTYENAVEYALKYCLTKLL